MGIKNRGILGEKGTPQILLKTLLEGSTLRGVKNLVFSMAFGYALTMKFNNSLNSSLNNLNRYGFWGFWSRFTPSKAVVESTWMYRWVVVILL